jgi:catechol 2,3-dioxygenase-like lactoylglutathione lyase family enzyme
MQFLGAERLVFIVRDFDRSLAFYRELLGLEPQGSTDSGWACFECGTLLLCLCAYSPGMPYEPSLLGSSPDQLLFRVDDIEASREELIRRGVDVRPIQQMSAEVRIAEFRDPDGRYLGLEQRSG